MDYLNLLADAESVNSMGDLCDSLGPVLRIVGILVFGIKIIVPIILIVVGMIDMAKAVAAKDENEIKKAQNALIKKAIAAVIVFLVTTIVVVLVGLVGNSNDTSNFNECMECIESPFSDSCKEN